MRMIIINPTPFWPSLDPWEKLTNVLERINIERIQMGGAFFAGASLKMALLVIVLLMTCIKNIARTNPIIGDMINDNPASATLCQLKVMS